VVTAQVDRRTGMAVDASCPGGGGLYTEYFIHRLPPAQMCYPTAPYPMAMGDSAWQDDEGGAWSYVDTVGSSDLQRRGITWPALEEKRRREAAGAPPPPPLPGDVEDPYGTTRPRARLGPPPTEPPPAGGERGREGEGTSTPRRPRVIGQPVDGSRPPPVTPDTAGHPG
jgi:hypothetical protein